MKISSIVDFRRSEAARNIAILVAGTGGAQALSILSAPLVTRLYGPHAYGVFGAFSALLAVLATIGAMGYPIALVLPKSNTEAISLTRLSAVVASLVVVLVLLIWLFFPDSLRNYQAVAEIGIYVGLLPVGLIIGVWSQVAAGWLARQGDFRSVSRTTLINAFWMNATRILLGLVWPSVAALIWTFVASQGTLAARMTRAARRNFDNSGREQNHLQAGLIRLPELARKYRDFPLYRAPQDFINAVSRGAPIAMLFTISGAANAGFYALAVQLMGIPSTLLGNAIGNVLYPDMARRAQDGHGVASAIVKGTVTLALLGIVPFGALCFFAPWLFAFVFGDSWRGAGVYAQWLAVFYYLNFVNRPAVAAIPVIGAQRGLLIYEVIATVAKLGGLYAGFRILDSDLAAIGLFSIAGAIAYAALIVWVVVVSARRD